MSDFTHRIEEELKEAFPVKNEGALRRAAEMISDRVVDRSTYSRDTADLRSDVRVIAETMRQGFAHVDTRFEDMHREMDRRFEHVDKRFSSIQWFMGAGFTLLVVLMSVYEFIS